VGRRIQVSEDLDQVGVVCEGRLVGQHERCWARHQTLSDPAHVVAAKSLRGDRLAVVPPPARAEVEQRALSDYDTVFGLDEGAL
jgi:hypothetical protein